MSYKNSLTPTESAKTKILQSNYVGMARHPSTTTDKLYHHDSFGYSKPLYTIFSFNLPRTHTRTHKTAAQWLA